MGCSGCQEWAGEGGCSIEDVAEEGEEGGGGAEDRDACFGAGWGD